MPQFKANDYDYQADTFRLANMNDGQEHNTSLSAGRVGELAEVELGTSDQGKFSEYFILGLGGFPDSQLRTKRGRVDGDLQDGGDGDVPASTEVRVRLTDKQRSKTYAQSRWYDVDEVEASNIENLPTLRFPGLDEAEFVREGRVVVVEVRAQTSFTPHRGNSTLKFPAVGGN
jgi:hypothetical protein